MSATIPLGPSAYRWSADPDDNARHVADQIDLASERFGPFPNRVVLLGFGEGAQVALETAARDPRSYRGAIALSPGGLGFHLEEIAGSDALAGQSFVVAVASFDSFDTVGTSYVDAALLRERGARVEVHTAWLYARHTFPPDFDAQLPRWMRFLSAGSPAP